ncbi:hypothetical protein L7F22_028960 [Adiantum nelumboides]|nr:hypothetical protein [Adiantum nelumboides]
MRDGQGCLLPVLPSPLPPLVLEEDRISSAPWLIPQLCRAEVISQLPEVMSSSLSPVNSSQNSVTSKRKRTHKYKDAIGRRGYDGARIIRKDFGNECGNGLFKNTSLCPGNLEGHFCLHKALGGELHADAKGVSDCETSKVQTEDKKARGPDGGCTDCTSYLPGLSDDIALRCLAHVSLSDLHRLALVAQRYRRLVRSSLLFELRRTYKVVEQWVCMYTSGDNGWTAFDPKQNVRRSLPPANVDPLFSLSDRESLSAGTHLLWLGREVFDFACYKYDLITNSWERGPPMVNSRCLFASASCGEFAFVAGGFKVGGPLTIGSTSCILNTAERYDARLGKWESLPSMEIPRQKCSGVYMDGKFYVIGGKDKDHNVLTSGEVYDPLSKTWKIIPNMYVPPETAPSFEPSPPLVAVVNNELYAIESSSNLLKGYIKSSNTWKVLGRVPVRTDVCNGWGLAFKALGDELFVIGSQESPSSRASNSGVAVFSWKARLDAVAPPPPEWKMVKLPVRGNGSFLYNCAVMSC